MSEPDTCLELNCFTFGRQGGGDGGPAAPPGSILDQRACFMVLILTAIRSALSGCKAGGGV